MLNGGRLSCNHCRARFANRPRGLCWTCYYNLSIRDRYPVKVKQGEGLGKTMARGLPTPTSALPGTEAKVVALMERAANGQQLWHPLDGARG